MAQYTKKYQSFFIEEIKLNRGFGDGYLRWLPEYGNLREQFRGLDCD